MNKLLDSIRNFGKRRASGNPTDAMSTLNDLDSRYGTNVLAFMDRAAVPPPIIPTGMRDSAQLLQQTNMSAGVRDASQGLGGALPSMSTPPLRSYLSQMDPRRGALKEDGEQRFLEDERGMLQDAYNKLPDYTPTPYGQSPFGLGFDSYRNQN
jgi:hypothetical protein